MNWIDDFDKYLSVIIVGIMFLVCFLVIFIVRYWQKKISKLAKKHYNYSNDLETEQFKITIKPSITHVCGFYNDRYRISLKNTGNGICVIRSVLYKYNEKELLDIKSALFKKMISTSQHNDLIIENSEMPEVTVGTILEKGEREYLYLSEKIKKDQISIYNKLFTDIKIEIKYSDSLNELYDYESQLINSD